MSDGGKGSVQRPLGIDWKRFEENWNEIFGNANNVVNKSSDSGSDLLRGVDVGEEQRDCGGAQHGSEDKPAE